RESLLEEYNRSGMSGVRFAQYLGIKYTTLAHWIRSRRRQRAREKLLMKASADAEAGRSNGTWIEAVVDKDGSRCREKADVLRIYFAPGAYCQVSSGAEVALTAELLGRLGAKAMISFSGSLKIFLLVDCCDMRKGFNGLYGLVSSSFGDDPRNGALYVFCNQRHTRIKILYFDGTGL